MTESTVGAVPAVQDTDGHRRITLRRPRSHNALRIADQEVLLEAILDAGDDTRVDSVVIAGDGPSFCSGVDVRDAGAAPARLAHRAADVATGDVTSLLVLHDVIRAMVACPKPIVTLLHGHVLGAGYDLALASDIRIATATASIGDPRILRAMPAAEGWSYLFPLHVGLGQLATIAYLGHPVTGETAAAMGLVHAVASADESLDDVAARVLTNMRRVGPDRLRSRKAAGHRSRALRLVDAPSGHHVG